jgi:hypothetical protein
MKKMIFGLLMVITLGIFSTTTVSAEPETGWNPPIVRGTIVINWRDYKDHSNIRPEEITIGLTNSNTGEIIKTTIKESESKVEERDGATTQWRYNILLPKDSHDDDVRYTFASADVKSPYFLRSNFGWLGDVNADGGEEIEIFIESSISKYITYTEHWDDDNRRDSGRICGLEMNPLNNPLEERQVLTCSEKENTYIDDNTCSLEVYIPYPYPFDETGAPTWNNPTQFSYNIIDRLDNYDYDIKVDEIGNIDVYIFHDPYRIEDSKVEVIWNDSNNKNKKRPDRLSIDVYNHDRKEHTMTVSKDNNWQNIVTKLYENFSEGIIKSNYSLKVSNTDDYEYIVTGNTKEGFIITANYIGKENSKTSTNNKIENPATSDMIMIYTIITIIGITGLSMITYHFTRQK